MWTITVTRPGYGRYQGGSFVTSQTFNDWNKAKDYYTDMLVKYPDCEVNLIRNEK